MSIKEQLQNVDMGGAEVGKNDLDSTQSGGFINSCGVFPTTIKEAFMKNTKKKGVQFDLHCGGVNSINLTLYIVSNKNGKLVTTCQMQGKTVSLPDFKMFKQLYYVATGEVLDLPEIETVEETVKYKDFGKNVEEEVETIPAMKGKDIQIGIRLEEDYAYDNDAGEVDMTDVKRDGDGNPRYKKSLFSVYMKDGKTPLEAINNEEAKQIEADKKFLASDKGIKRVKLELVDIPDEPEEDDIIDF